MADGFASLTLDELVTDLRGQGYVADRGLATSVLLALKLGKPLLLEGEVGVGKTELARTLATLLGRELIRLQCYEGIDVMRALGEPGGSESLTVDHDAGLRSAVPAALAGSEDDSGTGHRGAPRWIGPSTAARCAPVPPQRCWMISAAIEIAVSSGVRAPMSRPIGEWMRASSSSVTPASRSRATRSLWVRREPIAPMYPASVLSACTSAGTSNLGSCVSTAITVRRSTS